MKPTILLALKFVEFLKIPVEKIFELEETDRKTGFFFFPYSILPRGFKDA